MCIWNTIKQFDRKTGKIDYDFIHFNKDWQEHLFVLYCIDQMQKYEYFENNSKPIKGIIKYV